MKRLIIHSGLPKTGTSALQVFLARNHAALQRKSLDYFKLGEFSEGDAGLISSGNGFHIARALLPPGDPSAVANGAAILADAKRAIAASRCETGLLSSEYFTHCDPARLAAWLHELRAAGIETRLVYFIRAQDQLLSSMYVQYVKRSLCRESAEAYVTRIYRETPHLRHASFYKTNLGIFGEHNVAVRIYEDAFKIENGLFLAFLSAIGAEPSGLAFESRDINLGLTPAELAIMRELNKYRPHTRLSDQLVRNAQLAGKCAPGETYNLLPATLVTEIEAFFAAENAELAQLCFGRSNLFPRRRPSNGNQTTDEISPHDLVNVLGGLLVRYDERLAHLESRQGLARYRPLARLFRKVVTFPNAFRA